MTDKVVGFLDSIGVSTSENEIKHHGVKGMKWGVKRSDTNGDGKVDGAGGGGGDLEDELDELAKDTQDAENANAKFLAWKKLGTPLFDKSTVYAEGTGGKYVENMAGKKEFTSTGMKAKKVTKQGIVNNFVDKLLGRGGQKDLKPSSKPVVKTIDTNLDRLNKKKK